MRKSGSLAASLVLAGCSVGLAGDPPGTHSDGTAPVAPTIIPAERNTQAIQSPRGIEVTAHPPYRIKLAPASASGPTGYTPSQIKTAYQFSSLAENGAGQTIAIVDAYNDPYIRSDANTFSSNATISLPVFNANGGPTLAVVNQSGGSKLPKNNSSWGVEISLDVEWAHAIAPMANILLVEATSNSLGNLLAAVDYAKAHASVVSMSWGANEFSSESLYDYHFNVSGKVFCAASGDSSAAALWPALSPFVTAVGGTTLYLDSSGNRIATESAWSSTGGSVSSYETEPTYQSTYLGTQDTNPLKPQLNGRRGDADVSYDGDPNTGFSIYDSFAYQGYVGWYTVGGTSAGAPQWSALVALANQQRAASGSVPLSGTSLAANPFYNAAASTLYASDYTDIQSGSNGNPTLVNYDLPTGLGTPLSKYLVPFLVTQ